MATDNLSHVRQYFVDMVGLAAPSFRLWPDAFNVQNIPNTLFDKAFHVSYGSTTTTAIGNLYFEDEMPMSVQIFVKGFKNVQERLDYAMDVAHSIRVESISSDNANTQVNIKSVKSTGIEASFVESNDNAIIVTIGFTVRTVFCTM